jgi:CheY-specific phosphatase CheX
MESMDTFQAAICETVRNIWTVILGMEVSEASANVEILKKVNTGRTLTACVQLAGAWEGSIMLYCTSDLARRAASVMFGMDTEAVSNDEIEDALGELANMTAGNIKTLLPRPCELSLPAVVDGIDYRLVVPGSRISLKVLLECEQEPLLVTLLEKDPSEDRKAKE